MGAGFAFWGLFLVFGLIVIGYIYWMLTADKNEKDKS